MGRKRKRPSLLMCLMAASTVMTGILGSVPLPVKAAEDTMSYEARIGETHYGELEEAFVSAQAGDTITVLKDCRVSGTLEVTMDNITLQSEDAGKPVTVSRDEEFTGIRYSSETDTVLVAVKGSGFSTRDIQKPQERQSVLAKLHRKQAEIAQRSGKKEHQQAADHGIERGGK